PVSELVRALDNPAARRYEPDPRGLPIARGAVAQHYAARGYAVDPDDVLICSGTSEAYGFLFKLLCDPGDEVLIPAPSYPLFDHLCKLEEVHTRAYPLHYDGEWHIGLGELREAIHERTRAILVVSPNNPTGSYLKQPELRALEALGLPIISDEVFADYPLRDDPTRVRSVLESEHVLSFALGGLSKQAGLPQWKIAWLAMHGPEALRREAKARLELVADTYLSVATPTQYALPELLRLSRDVRTAIHARLQRNLSALRQALGAAPAVRVLDVEGGFYATLRLPSTRSEEAWVLELLEHDSVHVQPGFFFDFPNEAYVVVSLLTAPDVFDAGVERLLRRVEAQIRLDV
ncbi:MAG TPA: pyridoxal phosphate-dependent aminotransferase, partial [Polyangiales bacterium]|nr:pyridoxal phosphate-dependent aminotransferase [Polyangiales bacterium]